MYARVTTYQADPTRLEELRAKLPDIKEKLEEMNGLEDWYTVWRADGHGVVFTVFKDKETADASLNEVRGIWASLEPPVERGAEGGELRQRGDLGGLRGPPPI